MDKNKYYRVTSVRLCRYLYSLDLKKVYMKTVLRIGCLKSPML